VEDGPAERGVYVRDGWGPGRGFDASDHGAGTGLGAPSGQERMGPNPEPVPAGALAIAKNKGTNAVGVADAVMREGQRLKCACDPADIDLVVKRNSGQAADQKVIGLVESLWVAVLIVVALLTLGLGWREALVVAVAIPVVFGLTLAVNMLAG